MTRPRDAKGRFVRRTAPAPRAWGLVGGLVGGLIKVIGGLITFHWDLVLRGFVDILSSFVEGSFRSSPRLFH